MDEISRTGDAFCGIFWCYHQAFCVDGPVVCQYDGRAPDRDGLCQPDFHIQQHDGKSGRLVNQSGFSSFCHFHFSIGYPAINVTETNSIVSVGIGNTSFSLASSGESLSIKKGIGNNIIITSNALSKVNTDLPLE